ncbi:response regulator [Flavisolibacter nicotianae]|uniref:response regulator n=1 Tax=Flavisolibacter nicotianae TaxID=2364882 RepID=UPI000EAB9A61|nr:response regulator [Flavisolibacter nicotianae]
MPTKIKVLLVEDNADERLFMKEGFVQSGLYEVIGEAENGNDLLELLNSSNTYLPDVILSDLNMPGRNGYEVILDIKTNRAFAQIPVIILTTAPLKPYAKRCKELGACAYYTKPDTFLEYKEFAEKIYEDVNACISKTNLEYSSVKQARENFVQNLGLLTRLIFRSLQGDTRWQITDYLARQAN